MKNQAAAVMIINTILGAAMFILLFLAFFLWALKKKDKPVAITDTWTKEEADNELCTELTLYLESINGGGCPVPFKESRAGVLNVRGTLELPCYLGFPDRERWLAADAKKQKVMA